MTSQQGGHKMSNGQKKGGLTSKISSKTITAAAAIIVTALNAMIGYWGFSSAKEISTIKEDAEKKYRAISQVTEDIYYFQAKNLEREIDDLLKEIPGMEFTGAKADQVKSEVERAYKSIDTLEANIPADKRLTVRFLAEGFLCFIRADYENAVSKLNQYDRETPEKYLLLGQAYRKLKKVDRAEDVLAKVVILSKMNRADTIMAKSLETRGNLASDRGDQEGALMLYKKALQYDPGLYAIHYNSAAVYTLLDRYNDALKSLCSFSKYHDGDTVVEIESDPDGDFKKLMNYLGDDWKVKLRKQLVSCSK
jgi:tetratricopeptide (TPR) repeat protein